LGTIGQLIHEAIAALGSLAFLLAALASLIPLLLFIRQIGVSLGAKRLPSRVLNFLIWFGASIVALLVVLGCGGVMFAIGGDAKLLGALVWILGIVVVMLILFLRYLGTIAMASEEVKKRTSRSWV